MNKFKVGDEVERTISPDWKSDYCNRHVGKVTATEGYDIRVDGLQWSSENYWKLVHGAEEQAISFLTSLGYTVTEPQPKKTGKVYVHYDKKIDMLSTSMSGYCNESYETIAILDWTEGDGL